MGKKKREEPSFLSAAIITVLIIVLMPLPAAFYYAGWEWVLSGWSAVPREFIVTYVLGMIVVAGGIAWVLLKDRFTKDKRDFWRIDPDFIPLVRCEYFSRVSCP